MLSGESAAGKYPVEAVAVQRRVIARVEGDAAHWAARSRAPPSAPLLEPDAASFSAAPEGATRKRSAGSASRSESRSDRRCDHAAVVAACGLATRTNAACLAVVSPPLTSSSSSGAGPGEALGGASGGLGSGPTSDQGLVARLASRERCDVPILTVTEDAKAARQLSLLHGVYPTVLDLG